MELKLRLPPANPAEAFFDLGTAGLLYLSFSLSMLTDSSNIAVRANKQLFIRKWHILHGRVRNDSSLIWHARGLKTALGGKRAEAVGSDLFPSL